MEITKLGAADGLPPVHWASVSPADLGMLPLLSTGSCQYTPTQRFPLRLDDAG